MILTEPGLEIVFEESQILQIVKDQGSELAASFQSQAIRQATIVGNLVGGVYYFSDLTRSIGDGARGSGLELPILHYAFSRVASYGEGIMAREAQVLIRFSDEDIAKMQQSDRVIVADDIIDTGTAEKRMRIYLRTECGIDESKIEFVTPLIREGRTFISGLIKSHLVAPPGFLVGYGMGKGDAYRHLRGIYRFKNSM